MVTVDQKDMILIELSNQELFYASSCGNTGSIKIIMTGPTPMTGTKNSLDLVELSGTNKFSLV